MWRRRQFDPWGQLEVNDPRNRKNYKLFYQLAFWLDKSVRNIIKTWITFYNNMISQLVTILKTFLGTEHQQKVNDLWNS